MVLTRWSTLEVRRSVELGFWSIQVEESDQVSVVLCFVELCCVDVLEKKTLDVE